MIQLLADIHFGANKKGDVDAAVDVAKRHGKSGTVVIGGDFTQVASEKEYREAEKFIRALIDAGNTVVATPGNHDFGFHATPGTDKINILPTKYDRARTRYTRHVLRPILEQSAAQIVLDPEDGFDTITRIGDDVFVALRSTHRPRVTSLGWQVARIRERQIFWARDLLERKGWTELRLHFVTHRSIWQTVQPRGDKQKHKDKHPPMKQRRRLEEELFKELRFHSFVHGHNHALRFEDCETPYLGLPIRRISIPTLSHRVDRAGMMGPAFALWNPDDADVLTTCGPNQETTTHAPRQAITLMAAK